MASRTTPTNGKAEQAKRPTPKFSLVQAAKEREETEDRPEPFTVEVDGGEVVTLRDPHEIGWQEASVLSMGNPYAMMQTLLSPEDYEEFVKVDYKLPDVKSMTDAWRSYYKVTSLGN